MSEGGVSVETVPGVVPQADVDWSWFDGESERWRDLLDKLGS